MDELKIRAIRYPFDDRVHLLVQQGRNFGVKIEMQRKEISEHIEPTTVIECAAAQQLMDDLYAAGIRPTEARGSAGQLAAINAHLQDMRKLVFDHFGDVNKMGSGSYSRRQEKSGVE